MDRRTPSTVRRETVAHVAAATAFLLVYAFLLWNLRIGRLYAFGDLPPYYGARAIEKFVSTWHFTQLGYSYQYNVIPAYLGIITAVGGALAQNLFYLLLIPAGYLGFVVFVGRFVDSTPVRHLSAGLYAINPLTIGEFANGDVVALLGFAGLPLVLHYLYLVVERDSWLPSLKAGMVFGATTVVPWLGFWMVGPFAAILAYRARSERRTLLKLCGAGAVGVLLALPAVYNMVQRAVGLESSIGRELLLDSLRWNYAEATPLALLRLAGNRGDRALEVLGYNADPVLAAVGLVVPGISLLALHRERQRPYFYVVVGIVVFAFATNLGLTYPLFDLFPPLLSVRNPSKLMYPLLVSLCVLFGGGLEWALDSDSVQRGGGLDSIRAGILSGYDRRSALILGLSLLLLFTYAIPAAGTFGVEDVRGEGYYVPEEQQSLAERLDGRVLWVPYTYTTQLRLRHAYPDHVGVKSGGIYHGIQSHEYVSDLFESFAERPMDARPVLATLGVTHIVVAQSAPGPDPTMERGPPRVRQKWGAPWLAGDPATFRQALDESSAYTAALRTDRYTVYRVRGVEEQDRYEQFQGLHAIRYPTEPSVEEVGENCLANPSFDDGTNGWWTPPEVSQEVVGEGGENALLLEPDDPSSTRAIAQQIGVRERHPYRVSVDAEGNATVLLVWYDGEKSPENLVTTETYDVNDVPTVVRAKGSVLSFRVKPDASRVLIGEASVVRTTYPERTGFAANTDGVPGAVVDGRDDPPDAATSVAVNPDGGAEPGTPVRLVDAESVLGGRLVFDSSYRQGAAVALEGDGLPPAVPPDARAVTRETPSGTVLDYWVEGSFDETSVTVLHTSYDEDWVGPPGSEHFLANGWANGFTESNPDEIRWTGGDGLRLRVLQLWVVLWVVGLGLLVVPAVRKRRGRGLDEWRPAESRLPGGLGRDD